MISIEKSAKTVKEAIRLGLEELKCDSADVEIEVLEMGSPGIFGMFGKPVKVRLTRKDAVDEFDIEMPHLSLDGAPASRKGKGEKPARKKEPKENREPEKKTEEKAAEPRTERKVKARPKKENKENRESREPAETAEVQPTAESAAEKAAEAVVIEEEPFVPTEEDKLSESALLARSFVKELSSKMGAEVELEIQETKEQLRIKMTGENMSMLIGRRGETLDSIQYLTSLCVNRSREEYLRVSLDTENYRAKREEALRRLANRMANRARKTGKRVSLEPMNPYERRILHSALQNDPDVTTHSEGEEPYRRVIITLK